MDRDTEYKPSDSALPEERAYGSLSEPPARDAAREDREAAQSDATGRISKREVDELRADAGNVQTKGTRRQGKGNDAYKRERELDQSLADEGAI